MSPTRDHVARVHRVLVLNEAEAIHKLDLGDLASAMGLEMGLDVGLGGVAREVAQVKAGARDFSHGGLVRSLSAGNLAWSWK
jgi:hypothetical protein